MTTPRRGDIYILTGERGAGKSVVCARVAEQVRESGHTVGGLLTETAARAAVTTGASSESRYVVDLSVGERFPFGSRCAPAAGAPAVDRSEAATDEVLPGWRLDAHAWARGNEVLIAATPCDLLIVDELGPLELRAGRGWIEAFTVLGSRDYRAALVVCRPDLVDELIRRLGGSSLKVFEVDRESRDALPGRIVQELLGAGPRRRQSR